MTPTLITVKNGKARPKNPHEGSSQSASFLYAKFEDTVQWHDCPEDTEDGEFMGELAWQFYAPNQLHPIWKDCGEDWFVEYAKRNGCHTRQIWRIVPQPQEKKTMNYQPLFDLMSDHGLTLLEGEMDEIINCVNNLSRPQEKQDVIDYLVQRIDKAEIRCYKLENALREFTLHYKELAESGNCGFVWQAEGKPSYDKCIAILNTTEIDNTPTQLTDTNVAQSEEKEEAKTVEGKTPEQIYKDVHMKYGAMGGNADKYDLEAMQAYSSQQNKALQKRLDNAVNFANGIICIELLKIPSELLVKYKIDIDSVVAKLEKALKPKQ